MSLKKRKRNAKPPCSFAPGDKVVIRMNPHYHGAKDIVGTVVRHRPGEGFAGVDLVDVRYKHPRLRQWQTMPFGVPSLDPVTPANLLALAKQLEDTALALRRLLAKLATA